MKKYLFLICFALIASVSFAQKNYQDVVYLKNGSIIRGVIIEQVPEKSIKIETQDRNVFFFEMEEIEKFTKEEIPGDSRATGERSGLNQGYRGVVETGFDLGVGDFGMDRFKVNIINGYQINPHFSLGLGTGVRYYLEADAVLIPLFADFRTNFIDNVVSPYLSLGVGYTFDASNDLEGVGFLFNPTMGVSFMIADNSSMNVGLGYEMQRMKFISSNHYYPYYYNEFTNNSGALSIIFGITF